MRISVARLIPTTERSGSERGSAQPANTTNSANLVIRIMRSGCPCHLLRRKSVPSGYGRDRLAARYDLSDDPCLVLVAPRSPATCTGEHLKPMKRLSDSIIHCVHSKPNGYQNHQTRRSGHHQEGDLGTPLTLNRHRGHVLRRIPDIARGVKNHVAAHEQIDVGAQGKACRLAELDRILCFYRAGSRYPNPAPIFT